MAEDEDRTFAPNEAQANRASTQGLGAGQREMDQQRDPSRFHEATRPDSPSWRGDMEAPTNADRPGQEASGDGEQPQRRDGWGLDPNLGRNEAGIGDVEGDLGAGTPANVDIHKLGQSDNPEEEWGEPAGEGAQFSSNHTRRAEKTEAERGQGAKTRAFNKDQMSRRT
jgi:hypothetical protein